MDYLLTCNNAVAYNNFNKIEQIYNNNIEDKNIKYTNSSPATVNTRVFVARVSFESTSADVLTYFQNFGEVTDLYLPKDPYNPTLNKGFGFVSFKYIESAARVLAWPLHVINGREVVVDSAVERTDEEIYASTTPYCSQKKGRDGYIQDDACTSGHEAQYLTRGCTAISVHALNQEENILQCILRRTDDIRDVNDAHELESDSPLEVEVKIPLDTFERFCSKAIICNLRFTIDSYTKQTTSKIQKPVHSRCKPSEPHRTKPLQSSEGFLPPPPMRDVVGRRLHQQQLSDQYLVVDTNDVYRIPPSHPPNGFHLQPPVPPPFNNQMYRPQQEGGGNVYKSNKAPPGGSEWTKRGHRIHIGQLKKSITAKTLKAYFEQFGEVVDAYIPKDYPSHQQKKFGFVSFLDPKIVQNLIRSANTKTHEICGEPITISKAFVS